MPASSSRDPISVNALVVDDQPSTLMLMHAMLDRAGFRVHECATGQMAIDALANGNTTSSSSIWNLPDMSGLDLLQRTGEEITARARHYGVDHARVGQSAESAGIIRVLRNPYRASS